jgi:hypothetical protein
MSYEEVSSARIMGNATLDEVIVYWHNVGVGKGYVTLVCWGSAWTAYFGAMGEDTIQEFFSKANRGYLINKLGFTQWLKTSKRHEAYLGRVIDAVKSSLLPSPAASNPQDATEIDAARK